MKTTKSSSPFPSVVRFDSDVQEIEDKLMSISHSNDSIRKKLSAIISNVQELKKGKGCQTRKANFKKSACPPAKSAKIVRESIETSLKLIDLKENQLFSVRGQVNGEKIFDSEKRMEENGNFSMHRPRSFSCGESGSRNRINVEDFHSYTKQSEMNSSNKSLNSIFRLHQTLNSPMKGGGDRESSINQNENKCKPLTGYSLLESYNSYNKPVRPTSLFVSQRINQMNNYSTKKARPFEHQKERNSQSSQSLDQYLENLSNKQTKKQRSERAEKAIDSCLLLMRNLINE